MGYPERTERIALLHPKHAPHAERLRFGAAIVRFAEIQQCTQFFLCFFALQLRAVRAIEPSVWLLYESLGDSVDAVGQFPAFSASRGQSVQFIRRVANEAAAVDLVQVLRRWPSVKVCAIQAHRTEGGGYAFGHSHFEVLPVFKRQCAFDLQIDQGFLWLADGAQLGLQVIDIDLAIHLFGQGFPGIDSGLKRGNCGSGLRV